MDVRIEVHALLFLFSFICVGIAIVLLIDKADRLARHLARLERA